MLLWAFILYSATTSFQVGPFDSKEICEEARVAINETLFAGRPYPTSKCFQVRKP